MSDTFRLTVVVLTRFNPTVIDATFWETTLIEMSAVATGRQRWKIDTVLGESRMRHRIDTTPRARNQPALVVERARAARSDLHRYAYLDSRLHFSTPLAERKTHQRYARPGRQLSTSTG